MNYIVAGAGPAGVIGAETLRKADPKGSITLIGGEDEPPYSRMAIPYLLAGNIEEKGTYLRREGDHYDKQKIEYLRNKRIAKVDSTAKQVTLDDGKTLPYDRLLLATGSHPLVPPIPGIDQEGIHPCWTLQDARHVNELAREGSQVVLIGAGFIGSIILDAIAGRKTDLTVVEAENRMVPRMMNEVGGEVIRKWCEGKGVKILTSTRVEAIEAGGARSFSLRLDNGSTLEADLIVTATGVASNIGFLENSGVETDQGVLVNDHMQTSVPEIYAAGDVAQGKDFSLGQNFVHAIQPTAAEHARIAALNMAGQDVAYRGSLSMNVVDTLGLAHYTFGQWMGVEGGEHAEALDEPNSHYLRLEFSGDVLVGAINIGPFEHVGILRGLIQSRIPLGEWKQELLQNPKKIMEAYLSVTQAGQVPPRMSATGT
jgi:NAD(P)H-nitrite reductase large subunit